MQRCADLVSNVPKILLSALLRTLTPWLGLQNSSAALWYHREDRTRLVGTIAHGNHAVEVSADELVHILGKLAGNVDPNFIHYLDGFGPDWRWEIGRAHV